MDKKTYSIFNRLTKPLKKKQTPAVNLKPYRCPNCKYIIVLDNNYIQNISFKCPICGQINIFKKSLEKKPSRLKTFFSEISYNAIIIGLILTLTSIILLFNQNLFTTKLSLTILIIGGLFPLFITEKNQKISISITFGTTIYIILLFIATGTDLELFLVLIYIGVLTAKTVINEYIPKPLKIRMNLFIIVFFIIFLIIVIKKIISLVGI